MSTYKIYRHKNNPEIRYWVETCEVPHVDWSIAGNFPPPKMMPRPHFDSEETLVRIKSVRNVRFDNEDLPAEIAPEAGMWPYHNFLLLYELDERGGGCEHL